MARYRDFQLPKGTSGAELQRELKRLKILRYSVEILEVPSPTDATSTWKLRTWRGTPYTLAEHQEDPLPGP